MTKEDIFDSIVAGDLESWPTEDAILDQANDHAWEEAARKPSYSRTLSKKTLTQAQRRSDKKAQAKAHRTLAYTSVLEARPEQALDHLTEAEGLLSSIHDPDTLASIHDTRSNAYLTLANYDRAFENSIQSRKLYEDIGNIRGVAWSYDNAGIIYRASGDYQRAEESWNKGLELFKQIDYLFGLARINENIGNMYLEDLKDPNKAHEYYKEAFEWGQKADTGFAKTGSLLGLAITHRQLGELDRALEYLHQASDVEHSEDFYRARLLLEEARIEDLRENFSRAISILEKALSFRDHETLPETVAEIHYLYSLITEKREEYRESLAHFRKYHELRKNILDSQARTNLRNAEIRLATEKSENEARLTREKNQQIEAEQKKTDAILHAILPDAIVHDLKEHGSSPPVHVDSASVLFTDFIGFTNISKDISPARLVEELDYWFGAFESIVSKWNVAKVKTIGDAFMAVGGVIQHRPLHVLETIMAGLQIARFVEQHAHRGWGVRVGIHSGPLAAGVIGTDRYAYDVWGDTVNLASRMESNSSENAVLVSDDSFRQVTNWFTAIDQGEIELKNRGKQRAWLITGITLRYSKPDDPSEPNERFYQDYEAIRHTSD